MELERPFDATVGSRPTTTCNKSQKLKHVEESLNLEGSGEILCLYLLINLINGSYPHKRSAKMSLY